MAEILGDETRVAGYCSRVELFTDDPAEAKGLMPDEQLRQDVMALLRTYMGCDYDLRFWLTVPTRLLQVPRLGDAGLFNGYNMMRGLRKTISTRCGQSRVSGWGGCVRTMRRLGGYNVSDPKVLPWFWKSEESPLICCSSRTKVATIPPVILDSYYGNTT